MTPSAISPSSPTWTTARPPWSTPCSGRAESFVSIRKWPSGSWIPTNSNASAASPSWPRTRRFSIAASASISWIPPATATLAAKSSAPCAWWMACSSWWTPAKAHYPRRDTSCKRLCRRNCLPSSSSIKSIAPTPAPPRSSTRSTASSSTSTPSRTNSISRCSIPTPRPASPTANGGNPAEMMPAPAGDPQKTLQVQVTNLDYSDYLGRIAIARVFEGTLHRGDQVGIAKLDGSLQTTRITKLFTFRGLDRDEAETVSAGDIVAIAGVEGIQIGETLTDPENPAPLDPLLIDEPTLAMIFTVNNSPLAGRVGQWVTSRDLRDRLQKELLTNVSIRVENTDTPEAFRVLGRGELQLAILIETMRREGYEVMVGKPEIVVRSEKGSKLEPVERLVVDIPDNFIGIIMETIGARRGELTQMINHGSGRVRMEFRIPSRGLIGLRGQMLTETRGTALIHSILAGWTDYGGEMASRATGALVADRAGMTTAYALWNLQERGVLFVGPGTEVYEGMIVGDNSREADMDVNVTKEKKQTNMRASTADEAIRLIPHRELSLEQAIEYIAEDEYVEVTPKALRLRKKVLDAKKRPRRWQQIRASAETPV